MAKARRSRARIVLGVTEAGRIKQRLLGSINGQPSSIGFVCSESWADLCVNAIEAGEVPPRKKMKGLERDLFANSIYPPGGAASAMVENFRTMKWMPPDYTRRPLDDREDRLTMAEGCKLPGSNSAAVIRQIRYMRSRPEKSRIKS